MYWTKTLQKYKGLRTTLTPAILLGKSQQEVTLEYRDGFFRTQQCHKRDSKLKYIKQPISRLHIWMQTILKDRKHNQHRHNLLENETWNFQRAAVCLLTHLGWGARRRRGPPSSSSSSQRPGGKQRWTIALPAAVSDGISAEWLRPQPDIKDRFLQLPPAGQRLPVKLQNHQRHSFRSVSKI